MKFYLLSIFISSTLLIGCNNTNKQTQRVVPDNKSAVSQSYSFIKLQTLEGRDTMLSSLIKNKASVFIFLAPDCPLSQSYTLTLNEFSKTYLKNKISFYGIFPGTFYSIEKIKYFQQKYLIEFPLLLDTNYALTRLFNANITPEVFVVDSICHVLYCGRIDNWAYEVSKKRANITEHNLQDALDSIISNKPVAVKKTPAVGCFIEVPKK